MIDAKGGDNTAQPRNTRNYVLRDGHEIVYHGITEDIERRVPEHVRSGKEFTSCTFSRPRTRESARRHEAEAIARYERNQGRKPRYNKQG